MNEIAIGLLSSLLATNSPVAARMSATMGKAAEEAEAAYRAVLQADEDALAEVNRWIEENNRFRAAGGGASPEELALKASTRLNSVVEQYEEFLGKHPRHVEGRIALGSFLNEISQEERAAAEWDRARLLDPSHPAPWNNLANHFGHYGPVTNAFVYYARAIELAPWEPIYYQNLATTVYLFRRDAERHYGIDEQQVFDRALELYRKALELNPGDFAAANDLAQTYYGITPFRQADAEAAWQQAFKLATTDIDKQGVYVHLARLDIRAGDFNAASNHLHDVTLPQYSELRDRLFRLMETKRKEATNQPATALESHLENSDP